MSEGNTDVAKCEPKEASQSTVAPEPEKVKNVEAALERSDLPKNVKELILGVFRSERIGPIENPLFSKMTEEHISKIIEVTESADVRKDKKQKRRDYISVFYFVFALMFVVFLIYSFKADKPFLSTILISLLAFIGGAGLAFGAKAKK